MKNVLFCRSLFTLFIALTLPFAGSAVAGNKVFTFDLVSSQALLPNAHGQVRIQSFGPVEVMTVKVFGLPPNTDFDFFVIQQPTAPFGLSWYQGDIETNRFGVGFGTFIGRFSIETFIVAPLKNPLDPLSGAAAAPTPHNNPPFPDASTNPPTFPVHTYHLGLWFNSPQDAEKAVKNGTVTPFNGEHHAGVQVLNSSNFLPGNGPLFFVQP